MKKDINNKSYLVIGAARSGLAAAHLLKNHGFEVTVADSKSPSQLAAVVRELNDADIPYMFGTGEGDNPSLGGWDVLALSPGVPPSIPLIQEARRLGIEVIGEIELGYCFSSNPILAITGTNGKSTTTLLAEAMLKSGKIPAIASGNVGYAFCRAIQKGLPENGIHVVEISSYQLETIKSFRPHIAAILNIRPDHLARHGNMENYKKAKFRLTENQQANDFLILNADDALCLEVADITEAATRFFSVKKEVSPGAFLKGDSLYFSMEDGKAERFMSRNEIPLPGLHNVQNILAAGLTALSAGVSPAAIADAVKAFPGVEHRIEFVGNIDGVDYYNDSKATNLDSLRVALLSFDRPVVLIAGGRDKGEDYSTLNSLISKHVRKIIAMGESAPLIESTWQTLIPVTRVSNMEEAVEMAAMESTRGEVVLLSPGASSFDAYTDFEERGRVFKEVFNQYRSQNMKAEEAG